MLRDAPDRPTVYARAVVAGEIVAGPWVRAAAARHLTDLETAAGRGLVWWPESAQHVIDFFERWLVLPTGQPFRLAEWQAFVVGSLYGWEWARGGRRFRTAYIEIGKGNGKTPMAAGLGLYGLVASDELAAEVYVAATTREQASICFRDARLMAEQSPRLAGLLDIGEHNLACRRTSSFLRSVSSEHRALDGKRVAVGLIDELHEHPNNLVVSKISAGVKGRKSPLIVEITNSGWDKQTVCWEHHQYSTALLTGGVIDETWFAYVAALDDGDEWTDPAVWLKANPNLGVSIQAEYLEAQVAAALGRPSEMRLIQRLNFCVWTDAMTGWLPAGSWEACAGPTDWRILPASLLGRSCVAGLDLASTTDLTALVLLFRDPSSPADEPVYDVVPLVWCPADTVTERSRAGGVPYEVWARQGALLTTPGDVLDYGALLEMLRRLVAEYRVLALGYDRWGASKLVQDLEEVGFHADDRARDRRLVPIGQGYASLTAPTKEVEVLVRGGRIRHGGHPVLAWAMGNVTLEEDAAGNVKPSKGRSSEKIDPAVALIDAVAMALAETWQGASAYETRGIAWIG